MESDMAIAIKDWGTLYENSETKKYKHLKWVPIPNKHDGTGWAELWNLRKAPEIFAAFIIMLEIASKCPKRGVIHKDGVSYGPKEMALKSRAPESIFVDAIPALIKIGWIEEIEISGEIRKSSEEPPANRIEQNRIEQNRKTAAAPDTASGRPLLDYFVLKYKEKYGSDYVPSWAKDVRIFNDLLKASTEARVRQAIENYFLPNEYTDKRGRDVNGFRAGFNRMPAPPVDPYATMRHA